MPINGANVRRLYESYSNGGATFKPTGRSGRLGFVQQVHDLLGLTYDEQGRRVVRDAANKPEEFHFRELAEAMIGPDWYEQMGPRGPEEVLLQEDATDAVMPGHFANISAWNSTVAGLLEAKVISEYDKPEFISSQLAETIPLPNARSMKLIGYSDIGDDADKMLPGQRHPRAQFGERYTETPLTEKRGLGIDVTREAVQFDPTGSTLLQRAAEIGYRLGLNKELRVIDTFIGVDNSYNYNGTSYNTYLTTGAYVNDQANALTDWTDVDAALQLFADMTNPDTGEPIVVMGRDLLVMPARDMTARRVLNFTETEHRAQSSTEIGRGSNPAASLGLNYLTPSIHLYNRIVASGVTAASAKDYWFLGDFKRAFKYVENWAMTTKKASPDSYTMADRDLVFSMFVNEMGVAAVAEPRAIVRNKNDA